jgi:hypothetical protein
VPYTADFASGGGSVDLYERFQAKGGSTFTSWAKKATTTFPNALIAPLTQGDGRYEFYTVATDGQSAVREADAATADAYVVLDTVPPSSSISSGSGWTSYPAANVYVTSTDDVSGIARVDIYYQFKPVGGSTFGPWKPLAGDDSCYGNYSSCSFYRNLTEGDGSYNITSVAIDGAGNAEPGPSVVKATTMLDTVAPTASISPLAPVVKSSSVSITYTATDNVGGSGIYNVVIYERHQAADGTWSDWTGVKTATKSPVSVSISGDGRHEYYAYPCDYAGNCPAFVPVAQAFTVLDTQAPTSNAGPLTSPTTASSVNVPYTASDNAGGSGLASVDLYQRYTKPGSSPSGNYTKLTITPSGGVFAVPLTADGTYEFYTRATDVAGNVESAPPLTSPDATIVRSTPAPASYVSPSTAPYQKASPLQVQWVVTSTGGGLASVELWYRYTAPGATPGGSYTKSASNTYTGSATSGTFSYTASSDGTYEFYTIAVATNGTREAAPPLATPDATVVLDKVLPTASTTPLTSPTKNSSVDITYTASDNTNGSGLATVELWQRYTAPGGTAGSYTLLATNPGSASPQKFAGVALAADGRYEFYTIAVDRSGNRKAVPGSAEATIVKDTAAPSSTLTAAAATNATTINITYTINDGGGSGPTSIQLWKRYTAPGVTPSGSYSLVTTTTSTATSGTFSGVALSADGRYEFYSLAVDAAGNTEAVPGSAKVTVVRDQVVPTSSAGPLPAFVTGTALSVPYTASDNLNGSGISKVDLYQSYEAPGATTWSTYAKVGSPGTGTSGNIAITLSSGAGSYRFYTLATDAAANVEAVPSSPDATTVLDITAPTSSITALPSTSSASSISIAYTASDNTSGSGLANVECWYRYKASDGLTPGAWTTCGTSATASGTFTLTFTPGAGIYDVLTVAVDKAGNREGANGSPPAAAATPKSSVRAVSWAASAKVNTDTGTALQDNAAYAVGSDGTVYAVWEDSRNGNTDIYFSSRNPTTGVWAAETKLNTDTGTTGQRTPSIAIDGSGNLYVVWADDRNGSTNTDIYFAKRTGTTWSANIKVSDDTTSKIQSSPRISVSSAGIAVAVWYDARSSQVNIYSARLAAGSTTWSTNYKVTSNTSAVKAAPDVAVATDGTAWATWQDNQTGGGDIYAASLGPTATTWSTNTKVSDDSGASSLDKSPRIGLTSGNLPVVAYLDGRSTNAAVRVANRTSGGTWNATVGVSDSSAKPATGLALAVKADGGVVVAWDDTRSTSAIWGTQCEAGSGTSSVTRCATAEKWSDQTGASSHPTIVASTSKVYLGWRDDTAGGGDIRIRLRTPS